MKAPVLVVDPSPSARALADELDALGYRTRWAPDAGAALGLLVEHSFEAAIVELDLGEHGGLALRQELVHRLPGLPVIVVAENPSLDAALSAFRGGAFDLLPKPFDVDAIDLSLTRAAGHYALHKPVKRPERITSQRPSFEGIYGTSAPMEAMYDLIERVAPSFASVLIRGESGTGKELVARAIHARSRRAAGPFVAFNCAAVPDALLESELFGYERGAFTDAKASRPGLLRLAHGGTLFLDEIGDMSPALQPKLLRALQERVVRPVGGDRELPFNTRILAATHRDLEASVDQGAFRQDLFFRLNVVSIDVPALRERGADVVLLANHFLEELVQRDGKELYGFSESAEQRLASHSWPGNVRELRNTVEHAVAMARGEHVEVSDLPASLRAAGASAPLRSERRELGNLPTLDEVERRHILHVLEVAGGNKSVAARVLGIDRKTLHARLSRYLRPSAQSSLA